jgi:hypothetical protein
MSNPQAFPCLDSSGYGLSMRDPGMTLRDWFAGQALAAMSDVRDDGDYSEMTRDAGRPELEARWIATAAYRIADAMMAERGKK